MAVSVSEYDKWYTIVFADFMVSTYFWCEENRRSYAGIVNGKTGEEIIPAIYEHIGWIHDGFVQVRYNGKSGIINMNGDFVIPAEFTSLSQPCKNGFMIASKLLENANPEAWQFNDNGVINMHGEVVVPFEYATIGEFNSQGIALAGKWSETQFNEWNEAEMHYVLINKKGETVLDLGVYSVMSLWAAEADSDLLRISTTRNGLTQNGIINTNGEVIVPLIYDNMNLWWGGRFYSHELIGVSRNDKWGFIDIKGNVVVPLEYNHVSPFDNGFAYVWRDIITNQGWSESRVGVINSKGEFVIPLTDNYEDISHFSEGFAAVLVGGRNSSKWGYINISGDLVVPPMFDSANQFLNGYAIANIGRWWDGDGDERMPVRHFILNTHGEVVGEFESTGWYFVEAGFIVLSEDDGTFNEWGSPIYKSGFVNLLGQTVVTPQYERILHVGTDEDGTAYFWVQQNGLWGIYTARDA
jgi:hypothetical protein